jgi:tetratricopeptide (TPR) repeat protein
MNIGRINLGVGDKPLVSNSHNLSLLSIASVLREGSLFDDDNNHTINEDKNQINESNEGELVDFNVDESVDNLSEISLKKKSESLSTIGNKCANSGQYLEAIRFYSKAIALYDEDYRLYCNRSYCYERLMNYEDSLADALRSVILMPNKPKPYFRQGKALMGLKRYTDAEKAFIKILQIDPNCEDTKKELMKTRYLALRDFGISIEEASTAAINYKTIDEAIDGSLSRKISNNSIKCNSQFNASYDNHRIRHSLTPKPMTRFGSYKRSQSRPPVRVSSYMNFNTSTSSNASKTSFMHKRSHSMDNILRNKKNDFMAGKRIRDYRFPKNLFGYKGLWIGNVWPNCKVMQLRSIFVKYGSVDYVNVVGKSFCAFVNYHNPNSPRIAIANLYGQIIPGVSNGDRPLVFRFIPGNDQKDLHYMRPYQPKGTNECYFWRTTGCKDFNCPLLHYPVCKGIDFQPWMTKRNKKSFFN